MRALLVVLLLAAIGCAQDVDPDAAFYKGAELFEGKDWDGALAAWTSALDAGHDGAALQFNIGNAWLMKGRHGPAIYHFRRAAVFAPRDEDIAKNLEIARERVADSIARDELPTFLRKVLWVHHRTTPSEAMTLLAVLWLGGMMLLHLRVFWSRVWLTRIAVLMLILGLCVGISLGARALGIGAVQEGVILGAEVDVFTGPSDTAYSVYFKLREGAEVEVLDRVDDWVKIAVDEERRGYVPESAIGVL